MKVEVKLYFFHDMDLVMMYRFKNISFPEITRQVLNAYAQKRAFRVLMTDRAEVKTYNGYRKFMRYRLDLDTECDMPAIDLLNRIEHGYRNNFIKTILRQYLCAELSSEYLKNKDDAYFKERSEILQSKRENIQICRSERKKIKNTREKEKTQASLFESEENLGSIVRQKRKTEPCFTISEEKVSTEKAADFQEEKKAYSLEDDMDDFFGSAIQLF